MRREVRLKGKASSTKHSPKWILASESSSNDQIVGNRGGHVLSLVANGLVHRALRRDENRSIHAGTNMRSNLCSAWKSREDRKHSPPRKNLINTDETVVVPEKDVL